MSRPLSHSTAHALLHLTVFVWSFTAILGRAISIAAVPLVFYRLIFVVLAMSALAVFRRVRNEIRRTFTAYAEGRHDALNALQRQTHA